MAKRFGRTMLTPLKGSSRKQRGSGGTGRSSTGSSSNASMSVVSDNDTLYSVEGQQSVAAKTVDSQATLKASNKHEVEETEHPSTGKKESKPWRTIKRLVGSSSSSSSKKAPSTPNRAHTQSYDDAESSANKSTASSNGIWSAYPLRRRILSLDAANDPKNNTNNNKVDTSSDGFLSVRSTSELDVAIRGRLDGMDIMSLGPAERSLTLSSDLRKVTGKKTGKKKSPLKQQPNVSSSSPTTTTTTTKRTTTSSSSKTTTKNDAEAKATDSELNFDPLRLSFTGKPVSCTAVDVVFDMLWASDGKDHAELVLEGYVPGGSDRWTVRLEDVMEEHSTKTTEEDSSLERTNSKLSVTTDDDDDDDESTAVMTEDGSPTMPAHRLWDQMWGDDAPPPLPCHMQAGAESDKDEVLQLAAACSVPIDLDEDTFLIEKPEHLRAVHDLAMVPLQGRRFESALMVFNNLLAGLMSSSAEGMEHVVGVAHHNIGVLHMCQGHFGDALTSFQKAVTVRMECLPQNHPDIAVSLVRQGTAYFALESFEQALKSFEMALNMYPNEDATRAKLLNNIGVVHSFRRRYSHALKSFISALEIQRSWLESPVRRESIVYYASVTLENMGKIYLQRGDYDLSYLVYEEACVLQTTAFRKDHDIVLRSLENMGRVLAKRDDYEKASQILSSTHRSQQNRFGADSENCIETLGMMALMHAKLLDFNLALTHLSAVSKWQSNNLPPSHPSIRITRETMANVRSCKDGEASLWI